MQSLRAARPEIEFVGRGGPSMAAIAGGNFRDWNEDSAVLGLWEVLKHYGYFREQFSATMEEIRREKPNAVVLIDYPGFNLRLARALRSRKFSGLGGKIIYYISPQVWAWNRRRIPQMARSLDLMLCIFPFEAELYNKSGLRTIFVGHPMMESLDARRVAATREPNLIGLFPGSRLREVRKILPVLLQTAAFILARKPDAQFEIAAANSSLAAEIALSLPNERFRLTSGQASLLMQRAAVGIVASGTATLEAAYFRMPFVLVYRVAWLTYLAARLVLKVKHLGMPNVLANREIVPEFIQAKAKAESMGAAVLQLMNDRAQREQMIAEFDRVIAKLGPGGASEKAARAILDEIA
ncbi:MAG: lipid-A-disaccharide synthase [Verrucomicrobiota bacterium]|nr:lipid-A-disaccharide synthase [Verrucomicrobiota bacterium]